MASRSSDGPRSSSRFERRTARNRKIILVMAVLMGLSLLAPLLGSLLTDDGAAAPEADPETDPEEDPFAAPEEPQEPEETVGPCGETPGEVPEVTSTLYDAPFPMTIDEDADHTLTLATTCGDIVIDLVDDAPLAVNNLVNLAEAGYYEGVIFHRIADSPPVIQGGDPAGTGCGREDCTAASGEEPAFPGYTIEDELAGAEARAEEASEAFVDQLREELEVLLDQGVTPEDLGLPEDPSDDDLRELIPGVYTRGTVAMANAGPDTIGSQFFIVWEDTPLPPLYTVVGEVVDGMDVVDDIAASPTQVASDTPQRPYEPVVIRDAQVTTE